jgi:hypothetical protein
MEKSLTIAQFCEAESISKTYYYSLQERGDGPDELELPSSNGRVIKRITPQAHDAWRKRMLARAKSKAARLEAARRRERAVVAGIAAAESPRHVSKRVSRRRRPRR